MQICASDVGRRKVRVLAAMAVAVGLMIGGAARAQDVPPDRQALILTRALAYDNNLKSRAGDSVVLAVLYRSGNNSSESAADAILKGFRSLEGVKVQELPFRALSMPYPGRNGLKNLVTSQGIDVLYICPGLESEIGNIKDFSHHEHVMTMGAKEEFVSAGLSLGVFVVDGKNTITVNLAGSREEGVAFAAELLRIGRVIR